MKIKTAELIGPALDWAVATLEFSDNKGIKIKYNKMPWSNEPAVRIWYESLCTAKRYSPSTDWAQGGPIIEREKIGITWNAHWEVPNWSAWDAAKDEPRTLALLA